MVIFNTFEFPDSPLQHEFDAIRIILNKRDLGVGTLFVSENTLCWQHNQREQNYGFTMHFHDVSLHAISKDIVVHASDCVFLMTDGYLTMPDEPPPAVAEENGDGSDEEVDDPDYSELLIVPEIEPRELIVKDMYEAIKVGVETNPLPQEENQENDEEDNQFVDAEDHEIERNLGRRNVEHDIAELARRIRDNLPHVHVQYRNGHTEEEEFQDAD